MAWFKVDDGFTNSKPVLRIPRRYRLQAVGLWTMAGTWSAKEETDGFIPEYVLEELCGTPGIASQLVQAGLWEIVNGSSEDSLRIVNGSSSDPQLPGWAYRNWDKYQPTKAQLEEMREKERIRKANYRASQRDTNGTDAGQTERHHQESEHPDPTRPDPFSSSKEEEGRPEIELLCDKLADAIEANGAKRPTKTKAAKDAARLLLDKDGYTFKQVDWMIGWATSHSFWKANILSMVKLRDKFDQMKLQAMEDKNRVATGTFGGNIDVEAILGKDYWTVPEPPADMSITDGLAWKKAQRAAHDQEREQLARKKVEALAA